MNRVRRIWCRITWHDWVFTAGTYWWRRARCRRCGATIEARDEPERILDAVAEVAVVDRTHRCYEVGHQWIPIRTPGLQDGHQECARCRERGAPYPTMLEPGT